MLEDSSKRECKKLVAKKSESHWGLLWVASNTKGSFISAKARYRIIANSGCANACTSPGDYTSFFGKVREKQYAGWKSGLMQELIHD